MDLEPNIPLYYDDMILPSILYSTPDAKDAAVEPTVSNISTPSSNDVKVPEQKTRSCKSKKLRQRKKEKDFFCLECDFESETQKGLTLHRKKKHSVKILYPCGDCDFSSNKQDELIQHVSKCHSNSKQYICPHCDYSSPIQKNLKAHIVQKHKVRKFKCKDCEFSTDSSEKLQRHHETHITKDLSNDRCCFFCSFRTDIWRELKHHIRVTHENKKEHSCGSCDFKTVHKRSLEKHLASRHNKEQFYECPYCQFTASRAENLNRHIFRKHNISSDPIVCSTESSDDSSQTKFELQCYRNSPKPKTVGIKIRKNKFNRCMQAEPLFKSCSEETIYLESDTDESTAKYKMENIRAHFGRLETHVDYIHNKVAPRDQDKAVNSDYYFEYVPKQSLSDNIKMICKRKNYYECPICDFSSVYLKSFAKHIAQEHRKDRLSYCPICPYSVDSIHFIQLHILKHFNYGGRRNEERKAKNNGTSTFTTHLGNCVQNNHTSTNNCIKNQETKVKITSKCSPKDEIQTVIRKTKPKRKKERQIPCSFCKFIGNHHRELKNHVKTVHENFQEFTCPMCDFRTVHLASLKIHIMGKHTSERPYSCKKCSFTSVQPSNLKRHVQVKHSRNNHPV